MESRSSSIGSLVIAGAKAQMKGTRRIKRVGGYGFSLTATDGQKAGW